MEAWHSLLLLPCTAVLSSPIGNFAFHPVMTPRGFFASLDSSLTMLNFSFVYLSNTIEFSLGSGFYTSNYFTILAPRLHAWVKGLLFKTIAIPQWYMQSSFL